MRKIGIDLEGDPVTRQLVCIQYAERDATVTGGIRMWIHAAHESECREYLLSVLRDDDVMLVGMAWAMDTVWLCRWGGEEVRLAIVAKLTAGLIADVFIEEWLLWVAFPEFVELWQCATGWVYVSPGSEERKGSGDEKRPAMSLASIATRWCGLNMDASKRGEDSVRLTFGKVAGIAVSLWDKRYVDYAQEDPKVHLLCYEAHMAGVAHGLNAALSDRLSGLYKIFARVRGSRPDLASTLWAHMLPGEYKAVIDALPMAWLCEPHNGGLYVDSTYCDALIERYRSVAMAVEPLAGKMLRNVEARSQLSMFDVMLSSVALIKDSKIVKVNKKQLRRNAVVLFDRMPLEWAPLPTDTGIRKYGKFPRYWRDWDGLARSWASLSAKVLSECMLTYLAALPRSNESIEIARCMAWLLDKNNPGHAVHAVSSGKWDAAAVVADGLCIPDIEVRRVWAYVVRTTCLGTISNSLAPLAVFAEKNPHIAGVAHRQAVTPTRFKLLITGRNSLEGTIRQNANRGGGVREALIPETGNLVYLADFSQIELLGFAKVIEFAHAKQHGLTNYVSSLSRVLMAGKDAHIVLSLDLLTHTAPSMTDRLRAQALTADTDNPWLLHDIAARLRKLAKGWPKGKPYDAGATIGAIVDELREQAKRLNYGLGGMMQPAKFIETQRKQGDYTWTLESATVAWRIWRNRWYESAAFEKLCREIVARGGYYFHGQCWRVRGGLTLTQAANTMFQTPIAEMFKVAMWRAWNETFDKGSPMYRSKVVLPVHDEIVCVGPRETAPLALIRLQEIMVEAGREYLPGLPIGTSGAVLSRFAKAG